MSSKNLVAITQPDFFPWLGSIEKIFLADSFVFLDHVVNRPGDGLWTKRVKVLVNKEPNWIGLPLKKDPKREFVPINEMKIADDGKCRKKLFATLSNNYSKAPYFKDTIQLIEESIFYNTDFISELNIAFLKSIVEKLGLKSKKLIRSSDYKIDATSNKMLIDIVHAVNGDSYLYGKGSLDYLEFPLWENYNIELIDQNFIHPTYRHFNSQIFHPGLSIIDVIMNNGFDITASYFRTKKQLL